MSWTAPRTWVASETVTAAQLNTHVRDNLSFLAGPAGAHVDTSETTTSTSYTDLATSGPAVSVVTGASALVIVSAQASNNTASDTSSMAFAVSGATTVAASDTQQAAQVGSAPNGHVSSVSYVTGLTPGTNTFTAKYRVNAGTGTWLRRSIAVWPLP